MQLSDQSTIKQKRYCMSCYNSFVKVHYNDGTSKVNNKAYLAPLLCLLGASGQEQHHNIKIKYRSHILTYSSLDGVKDISLILSEEQNLSGLSFATEIRVATPIVCTLFFSVF